MSSNRALIGEFSASSLQLSRGGEELEGLRSHVGKFMRLRAEAPKGSRELRLLSELMVSTADCIAVLDLRWLALCLSNFKLISLNLKVVR